MGKKVTGLLEEVHKGHSYQGQFRSGSKQGVASSKDSLGVHTSLPYRLLPGLASLPFLRRHRLFPTSTQEFKGLAACIQALGLVPEPNQSNTSIVFTMTIVLKYCIFDREPLSLSLSSFCCCRFPFWRYRK